MNTRSVPASVLEFRPATSRCTFLCRVCRWLLAGLVPVRHHGGPGIVPGPGEPLRISSTGKAPHAGATLAAPTQGPLPAREKSVRWPFTNTVCGCQHPAIEGTAAPQAVSIIKKRLLEPSGSTKKKVVSGDGT